jgi:uncharacterized membrane-anchored protein
VGVIAGVVAFVGGVFAGLYYIFAAASGTPQTSLNIFLIAAAVLLLWVALGIVKYIITGSAEPFFSANVQVNTNVAETDNSDQPD